MTGETTTEEQQQTIRCDLHLEASADIQPEQAADCTCYTEQECTQPDGKFNGLVTGPMNISFNSLLLFKHVENCFHSVAIPEDLNQSFSIFMTITIIVLESLVKVKMIIKYTFIINVRYSI